MTDIERYWNKFWNDRRDAGSQNDMIFQKLSHEQICESMHDCEYLLIIGCGDGDGIELYEKKAKYITGIDLSQSAIHKASIRFPNHKFFTANMLKSGLTYNSYNSVISERSITNLDSVQDQQKMIDEVYKLLKPNGHFYLCEPSLQGYDEMDTMREKVGLNKLKRHWHNILLDENIIKNSKFKILHKYSFGMYSFISRILYPLYIYPEEPSFDSKMNDIAYKINANLSTYANVLPSQHVLYTLFKDDHQCLKVQ